MTSRTHPIAVSMFVIAIVTVSLLCGNVSSGKVNSKPVTYNLYFGDLHTHTGYSDAYEDSTPWDAYQAAIDAGADYMAITDHLAIWNAYSAFILDEEEWADTLAAAEYFTSKNFVAMAGYEAWLLANLGEINVYNTEKFPPRQQLGYRADRLPNFYDWLASEPGVIGQFNHPLYVSDNFEDFAYYTESRDVGMGIVEVWNGEFTEDSYIMALDAGWHVMPSANSDTHYSDWIAGHEMRTVLLAESLTPEDLYAAMSASRGYATLDKNLEIQFTVNDQVMGSILSSTSSGYTVQIHIEDPDGVIEDDITLVEVISDGGGVVATVPTSGTVVDLTLTLSSDSATYFYLRVTTASDHEGTPGVTAWTAPVWTGL